MDDITDRMMAYRECCRHIWNSYFLKVDWLEREIDYWDYFDLINRTLLEDTVLKQVMEEQETQLNQDGYYEKVKVIPQLGPLGYLAMYGKPDGNTTNWNIIELKSNDNDFRFIELFDWTVERVKDYQYARVRLVKSVEFPNDVGYDFLLESWRVSFVLSQ